MRKIIISVSKTYIHRGRHLRHRQGTRKKWHVYYYQFDAEDGKYRLKTQKINWLQALYYKARKQHRYKYYCSDCGSAVVALLKSKKSALDCPICAQTPAR